MRSDYYAHLTTTPGLDEAERKAAFASYGRDLAAASEDARSPPQRALIEVDRGLISSDWTTMKARYEAALAPETCYQGVWLETAPLFGYAEELMVHAQRRIACDPLNFFNAYDAARAALWSGRPEKALELARTGIAQADDDVWLKSMEVLALLAARPRASRSPITARWRCCRSLSSPETRRQRKPSGRRPWTKRRPGSGCT